MPRMLAVAIGSTVGGLTGFWAQPAWLGAQAFFDMRISPGRWWRQPRQMVLESSTPDRKTATRRVGFPGSWPQQTSLLSLCSPARFVDTATRVKITSRLRSRHMPGP